MPPTITNPQTTIATAQKYCCCRKSTPAAGSQMSPLPTTGRIANSAVTTLQNTGLASPVAQNASPRSAPCTAAVRKVPIRVEIVTSLKRFCSALALSALNGMNGLRWPAVFSGARSM